MSFALTLVPGAVDRLRVALRDMRALGREGGKAGGLAGRLKRGGGANVRDELRGIDPRKVRAAIERSLTGNNESARVGAIRLLADLEVYRPGADECEVCKLRESLKEEQEWTLEQARGAMEELARCGVLQQFIERVGAGEGGNGGTGGGVQMGPVRPSEN